MLTVDQIPFIAIVVRIWQALAFIYPRPETKWRAYAFLLPMCAFNVLEFFYVYDMWGDLVEFTLNLFFATTVFNGIFRCIMISLSRRKVELLLKQLAEMYNEIKSSNDQHAFFILEKTTRVARTFSIFNLALVFLDAIFALLSPVLVNKREHPLGVSIPMVNMTSTPYYEIFYALQLSFPFVMPTLYMTYVSFIVAISLFSKALLRILNYKIGQIRPEVKPREIIVIIRYYQRIKIFIALFNDIVTYIALVEFMIFGVIICLLLFCINIATESAPIVIMSFYLSTVFYVLFIYYWHANELVIENINISQAVYGMPWYAFDSKLRKTVLIFLMATKRPLMLRVGNLYPMTLVTFQSLLSGSYKLFTMLRGITSSE